MSFVLDLLGQHASLSVVAVVGVIWVAWKYRRLQAWAGLVIGGLSTAGFAGVTILVAAGIATAAGWLDPATVVSDLVGWGSAVWNMVGDTIVGALEGVLPE